MLNTKKPSSWLELIRRYQPYNEQEQADKEKFIYCSENFTDILTRANEIAHLTSSAFVVNGARDKTLMVHHNIYNNWSWPGGHADGEGNLLAVAVKEVQEETGITGVRPLTADIFSLDVLPVLAHNRRGKYISAHLHLSVAFLLEADEHERLMVKDDENSGVKWMALDQMDLQTNEPHMQQLYHKLIAKIKE